MPQHRDWALLLCLLMSVAAGTPSRGQDPPTMLESSPPPFMLQGRVMVPLRTIIAWMAGDIAFQRGTINASVRARRVTLRVGSKQARVDGRTVRIAVAPVIRNGATFVPLRFVSEGLGAEVVAQNGNPHVSIILDGRRAVIHMPLTRDQAVGVVRQFVGPTLIIFMDEVEEDGGYWDVTVRGHGADTSPRVGHYMVSALTGQVLREDLTSMEYSEVRPAFSP